MSTDCARVFYICVQWCPSALKRVEDSNWRLFLRRLTDFFKPTNNHFARMELGKGSSSLYAKVGCTLVQVVAEEIEVPLKSRK